MEKVKLDDFSVNITGRWKCPHCGTFNEFSYSHSPYTAVADDPGDEMCKNCEKFYTMNYYDD